MDPRPGFPDANDTREMVVVRAKADAIDDAAAAAAATEGAGAGSSGGKSDGSDSKGRRK